MKYLSLFSGYGGFELGIQQAYENNRTNKKQTAGEQGLSSSRNFSVFTSTNGKYEQGKPTCIGYSEIDKYAIQVYNKHFNHKNYGDITKINPKTLPDFDLLCGGFPCQAFSIAGKRQGFNDTRGTLFFDVARIVKEKQPKILLLENVKGLLSHEQGKTFRTILKTLDELGYDAEWQVLNAKDFGVPQNRERVFIIGHLGGFGGRKVFPIGCSDGQDTKQSRGKGNIVTTIKTKQGAMQNDSTYIVQINKPKHSNDRVYSEKGISPTLNTMQGGNRQPFITNPYNGKTSSEETGTLGTSCGTTTGKTAQHLIKDSRIRRLTPKECERLMGLKDDWTAEGIDGKISDTQRYKLCGNGLVPQIVTEIVKKLI